MKKLVFLGNCQTRRLEVLYDQKFAPITGDTTEFIASFENFTPRVRQTMAEADIIVSQATDTEQKVSVRKTETNAQIIEFPYISGMFLWPYSGRAHIHNQAVLPRLPDGPYGAQLGNPWLNNRIKAGEKPEAIAAEYEALDLTKVINLDRTFEIALDRARKRDERTGFDISKIIEERLTDTPLFMTPDNFELALFRPLAAEVYKRLGIPGGVVEAMLDTMWRTPFPIADHPIHPSVARHFGLKFIGPDTRYRTFTGELLTFREWIGRYVRYEWNDTLLEGIDRSMRVRQFDAEAESVLNMIDSGLAASNGSAAGYTRRGHLLYLKGDRAGTLQAARDAAAFEHKNPQTQGTLAIYLAEQGKLDDAESVARALLSQWPHYADGWNRLGSILARRSKMDEAVAAVRRATESEPRNTDFRKHLSGLLLDTGQAEQARHVLTDIIAMMPERADLYTELSRVLMRCDDPDAALTAIKRAVNLEKDNVALRGQLADLLVQRGDFIGASIVLREVMELAPDQPSLCISLANLMIRLGQQDQAIAEFRRAIALQPRNIQLHNQLADTLYATGDLDAAEQAYRASITLDPGHIALRGTLALVIGRLGRTEESLEVIEEAIALAPEDPHLLAKHGFLLVQKGDLSKARSIVERAIAFAPRIPGLYVSLADVLERQNDHSLALKAYQSAAALEPESQHFQHQIERLIRKIDLANQADAAE